jgi:hypothetical protein
LTEWYFGGEMAINRRPLRGQSDSFHIMFCHVTYATLTRSSGILAKG